MRQPSQITFSANGATHAESPPWIVMLSTLLMHLAKKASKDCASVFTYTQVLSRDIFTDVLTQLAVDMVPLKRTDYFVPIDTEAVSGDDRKLAIDWATADRFEAIISTDGAADRPLMSD
jgi:hypothetical protein